MNSKRCAGCKYLRRRCPSDCILSPYFPPNNPQRFYYVHRIYGASNVGKMLQQVPVNQRAAAANAICEEAYYRIRDPVYGCVGTISRLQQQIYDAQCELAMIRAEIAVYHAQTQLSGQQFGPSFQPDFSAGGYGASSSAYDPFSGVPQFYSGFM